MSFPWKCDDVDKTTKRDAMTSHHDVTSADVAASAVREERSGGVCVTWKKWGSRSCLSCARVGCWWWAKFDVLYSAAPGGHGRFAFTAVVRACRQTKHRFVRLVHIASCARMASGVNQRLAPEVVNTCTSGPVFITAKL